MSPTRLLRVWGNRLKKKLKFEGVAVSHEEGGSEVFADYYMLVILPSYA
jgi:hypothetical protein